MLTVGVVDYGIHPTRGGWLYTPSHAARRSIIAIAVEERIAFLMLRQGRTAKLIPLLGYAAIAVQTALVAFRPHHFQPDLRSYYFATVVARHGGDPYDLKAVSVAIAQAGFTDGQAYPFLYPPHTLLLFLPLTFLPFVVVYYLYLTTKIAAIGFLVITGRSLVNPRWRLYWPLFFAVVFNGAVLTDLRSGNVALFEAALVLMAFVALVKGRTTAFGIFITLASIWKVVLLPLAGLGTLVRSRRRAVVGVLLAPGLIALMLVLGRVLRPDLWEGFRQASGGTGSSLLSDQSTTSFRGSWNASVLRFISDFSYLAGGRPLPYVALGSYAVVSLAVVVVTVVVVWRNRDADPMALFAFCALAYGLAVPRLNTYSYILLIVPMAYLLSRVLRPTIGVTLAVLACLPFRYLPRIFLGGDAPNSLALLPFQYSTLFVVAGCWFFAAVALGGGQRISPSHLAELG